MISRKTFILLSLAAMPSLVAVAEAQPPAPVGSAMHPGMHPGHGPMMPPPLMGLLRNVGLTKAQHEKIHAILHAGRAERRAAMQQHRDIDRQIEGLLLSAGAVDKTKLAGLLRQKEALDAKQDAAMAEDAVRIHDVLTPEQRDKARVTREKLTALESQIHDLLRPHRDGMAAGKGDAGKDDVGKDDAEKGGEGDL